MEIRGGGEDENDQSYLNQHLGDNILTIEGRKFFAMVQSCDFKTKFTTKKYSVREPYLTHLDFIQDFRKEEFQILTTKCECDSLVISLKLKSEKVLADGSLSEN